MSKLHNNIFVVLMMIRGFHICSHQHLVIIAKRKTQQGNKTQKERRVSFKHLYVNIVT